MALSITRKLVALFTVGNEKPEPSAFVFFQNAVVEALTSANLLETSKSNSQPADTNKLWISAAADATVDPDTIKIPVAGNFLSASQANFCKYIAEQGGALDGVQTGNIAFNFYTSAAPGVLTIPTAWTTYSWFNPYLSSGTMNISGASGVTRSGGGETITGSATSAGQAMIMAVRET